MIADWEVENWVDRIRKLSSQGGVEGPVWFLWGTDHEDQPVINAKNLAAACPPEMCFDWKTHLQNARRSRKGGILSFVQVTCRAEETQAGFVDPRRHGEDNLRGEGGVSCRGAGDDDASHVDGGAGTLQAGDGAVCAGGVRTRQIEESSTFVNCGSESLVGRSNAVRESGDPCASEIRMREVMNQAPLDVARPSIASGRGPGTVTAGGLGDMCASEKRMREIEEAGGRGGGGGKIRKLLPGAAASRAGKGGGVAGQGGGAGILQFFGKK